MKARDLLGPLFRALEDLSTNDHGLILDIINSLKDSRDVVELRRRLASALHEQSAIVPKAEPPPPILICIKKTPLGDGNSVTTYRFAKDLSFPQMFRAVVKVDDDIAPNEIERLLKERKHAVKESKLDDMLAKQAKFFLGQEGGVDFGLRADWWNFILVEDKNGAISVVGVGWGGGRWDRSRNSLAFGHVWSRGFRLVVSNSDASNL